MNSSAVADTSTSQMSTSTRIVNRGERARQTRPDLYLWFFGQVHAKRFLIALMFILSCVSIFALTLTADNNYFFVPIPGLDDKFIDGADAKPIVDDMEAFNRATDRSTTAKATFDIQYKQERAIISRNIVNTWCYACLGSLVLAACGLRLAEKQRSPQPMLKGINPAIFLIPLQIIIFLFSVPIGIWSYRTSRYGVSRCFPARQCEGLFFYFNYARYIACPVIILWFGYLYVIFGCMLAFAYIWRRAEADVRARDLAAASFRSFRDKNTLMGRPLAPTSSQSCRSRFGFCRTGSLKNTTRGTGSRPTLSSIFRDLNDTRTSTASAPPDFASRTPSSIIDIEVGLGPGGDGTGGTLGTVGRRPLATVVEESESHGSQGSLEKA